MSAPKRLRQENYESRNSQAYMNGKIPEGGKDLRVENGAAGQSPEPLGTVRTTSGKLPFPLLLSALSPKLLSPLSGTLFEGAAQRTCCETGSRSRRPHPAQPGSKLCVSPISLSLKCVIPLSNSEEHTEPTKHKDHH